jgi:hypothetical protein
VTLSLSRFVPANESYAQLQLIAFDDVSKRVHCAYVSHKGQRVIELWAQNLGPRSCRLITPIDFDTKPFSLRLEKRGAVYAALWSTNGVEFQQLDPPALFVKERPARLGFVAAYDPTASSVALIDSFSVEALPPNTPAGSPQKPIR